MNEDRIDELWEQAFNISGATFIPDIPYSFLKIFVELVLADCEYESQDSM